MSEEREVPAPATPPARPDNDAINRLWRILDEAAAGRVRRALRGLDVRVVLEKQEAFNSRQVQFANDLLTYIDTRFEQTHQHYDSILGLHGRHMGEIDERHLILQEELVKHVHDLVRRLDLALLRSERGDASLETAVRDVRARLKTIEERLNSG